MDPLSIFSENVLGATGSAVANTGGTSPLSYFSQNFMLRYDLPIAAMVLVALFYVVGRVSVKKALGARYTAWTNWVLIAALSFVALLAVENYRATDYYRFNSYLNAYEFYHYYIGSKYGHEVGYTDMYAASLIADSETGMKWKEKTGTIRDLATGRHVNHKQFLAKADEYKAKFTPERWEEFKRDIVWFKGRLVQYRWDGILRDKGYNGTPVWTMLVGTLFSNRISTDSDWGMMFLALLDPILIFITFLMVVWAFGPRTALLMIVLLGTHYMMKWWHMKGAFLRTDWAMCLVMSACLIRKKQFAGAGVLTGYAALSRIFPAVLVFGIVAKLFWNVMEIAISQAKTLYERLRIARQPLEVRLLFVATVALFAVLFFWRTSALIHGVFIPWLSQENRDPMTLLSILGAGTGGYSPVLQAGMLALWVVFGAYLAALAAWGFWRKLIERRYVYFLLAFAITTVGLLGASQIYWRGTDYWSDYTTKISKHSSDISTWRVGYKYVFMADFGDDFKYMEKPIKSWQPKVRADWYRDKQPEWWRTQIGVLLLTLIVCIGLKDYRAYVLGFVPLFFLVSPTYYYYIMLLLPLLFFAPRIEHAPYALGMCLMYVTAMSGYWFYGIWQQNYGTYYWLSVEIMVMTLLMLALAFAESASYLLQQRKNESTKEEGAVTA